VQPILTELWILDADTTIKPLYGHQEGAAVGYNPHKPGRPSHAYHTFAVAGVRLVLDVAVDAGSLGRAQVKPSSPVRVISTRPAARNRPSCQNTTSAKVQWASKPSTCRMAALSLVVSGSSRHHDTYGSALAAQLDISQGAAQQRTRALSSSQRTTRLRRGLPVPLVSQICITPRLLGRAMTQMW
jgi:hypothetical protein